MPIPSFTSTCTGKQLIARDVYDLRFTKPKDWTFKSGQFVLWDVPLIDNPADIQKRSYSIASSPAESELIFVIKLIEGGRASKWIVDVVQEGTEVKMQGPSGLFVMHPENPKDFLFIATSTGIAPFRPFILDLIAAKDPRRIDVIFAVRSKEDLFWETELKDLAARHGNLHLHISLTQPDSSWAGLTGRVQSVLPRIIPDLSSVQLFACGNPGMTKEIRDRAIGEWKMEKRDVHVEGYV